MTRAGRSARAGEIVECAGELDGVELPLEIIECAPPSRKKVNLKAARIIVAGGAGVGSKENFRLVWDLANCLGAAVGQLAAAVDLGYVDHDHQVGQTGTTVRPACTSPAASAGPSSTAPAWKDSAKIVAINADREAPIFGIAHYGIVGDLNEVIPKLIKAVRGGARDLQ